MFFYSFLPEGQMPFKEFLEILIVLEMKSKTGQHHEYS